MFFVKSRTFPQHRVHYVQYQYFYFTFYLFGGAYAPNAPPPAYGPEDSTLGIRMRGVMGMNVDWNGNDPYYHVGKFQRICAKLHSLFHRD